MFHVCRDDHERALLNQLKKFKQHHIVRLRKILGQNRPRTTSPRKKPDWVHAEEESPEADSNKLDKLRFVKSLAPSLALVGIRLFSSDDVAVYSVRG